MNTISSKNIRVKRLELLKSEDHRILNTTWLPISAYSPLFAKLFINLTTANKKGVSIKLSYPYKNI